MRRLWNYYFYLILVWGAFRYWIHLPDVLVELWFKPLIWLVPLFWWGLSMPVRIKMFSKKWAESLFLGLVAGLFYFFLIRKFNINIPLKGNLLGIVFATAITEEITFSGFVAGYLEKISKNLTNNLWLVGIMVALMRLPILLFVNRVGVGELFGVLLFAGASGIINAWIRVKSGNISGSILARFLLNLAVLG